jgi:hypothetical protein
MVVEAQGRGIYMMLPEGIEKRPQAENNHKHVLDFDSKMRHLQIPVLLHLGVLVEWASKRGNDNRGDPVCRVSEDLICVLVFILHVFFKKP